MAASTLRLPPTDTHTGNLAASFSLPVILTRLRSRQMQEGGGKQRLPEHLPHSDLPLQGPPVPGIPRDLLAGSRPRNRSKYLSETFCTGKEGPNNQDFI